LTRQEHFDLVVVGSGPAGEKGAAQAAYFGKRVALIERAPRVGGASVHTGTLPSKTLRETALYLTGFRRRELYGMSLRLDRKKSLRQLVGRLQDVTDRQTRQIERNFKRHGIELIAGNARFEDASTVAVLGADGTVLRRLSAHAFLIATGSSPLPPPGIAMRDPDLVDSDRILDLDRVPTTLTVVGGGVIGTEYACLFAALGTRVTLVEGRDRLLGGVDEELSSALQLSLERMGAEVLLGDAVESVERIPGRATEALRRADRRLVGRVLEAFAARETARERQVLALVVGERLADPVEQREGDAQHEPERDARADPSSRRCHRRPSNRRAEICSDTSPTRNTTTAKRISSTDEFVTWLCVAIVHAMYEAPTANDARLIGRKMRSGLKSVTILKMIIRNFAPSRASLILDCPERCRAWIGSNATAYPAFMNASVVVVGVEKPFGSRCRNSRSPEDRAPRNPDVRSGMSRPVR
jgi:thioredoxin reductase